MEWFETVMKYGFKSNESEAKLLEDPDIRFVPTLMEKMVLPKLTGEYFFDCENILKILYEVRILFKIIFFVFFLLQSSSKRHGIHYHQRKRFVWLL